MTGVGFVKFKHALPVADLRGEKGPMPPSLGP